MTDSARKDRRLYAKFDIGMDEHTKIMFLSDAAFRALIESTMYSRRQLTDGFIDERVGIKKWGIDVINELTSNDDERPSWVKVDGGWQIHDFAEHQTTNADISRKREAGRKGGLAKAEHQSSKPVAGAKQVLQHLPSKSLAKTETETETKKKTSSTSTAEPSMEFEAFWQAYPRRVGKQAAQTALAKALKKTSLDKILEGIELLKRESAGKEAQFIPHASSWLNAGRWDDEPTTAITGTPSKASPWSKDFHQ